MFRKVLLFLFILLWCIPNITSADIGASDPSRLGIGARPLGMGRMFIPVADDASAIFMNPAGMYQADELMFMTMGSQVVWAVDYQVLGILMPIENWGAFGIGYAARNVADIALFSSAASVNNRVDRSLVEYGSYADSAMLLSWGRQFELFGLKRLGLGGSLKFFQKKGSGAASMEDAQASGTNLDLGVLWNWVDDINIAFTAQNILRPNNKSGTGVLTWQTGEVEYFDTIYKTGISNRFLKRQLLVGLEYEKNGSQPNYPGTGHLGLEWHPWRYLYFRGGIDQTFGMPDVNASSRFNIYNNVTLGLGLRFAGWQVDYAYHILNDVPNLTTHFISISLVGDEEFVEVEKEIEKIEGKEDIVVTSDVLEVYTPEDRTITHDASILVSGRVRDHQTVRINGEDFTVKDQGNFSVISPLGIGQNDIIVSVQNYPVKVLRRVLRLKSFIDVKTPPIKDPIEYLATLGFLDEDYDGYFKPERDVTRQEVATMLVKMRNISLPITMRGIWEDIDLAASQGLIVGFPDGLFRASEKLTKAQLAVILARFENLPIQQKSSLPLAQRYLAQEHWAAGAVQALVNTGLYKAEEFSPLSGYVTKEDLVAAFYKTSYVQRRVNNMLNFVDEPIAPMIPKRANLFMRTLQPADRDEQQIFEKIMGGEEQQIQATAEVPAIPPVAIDLSDIDIYQRIVAEKAETEAAQGSLETPMITILKPLDKTIVNKSILIVQGSAHNALKLYINNSSVYLKPDGKFYSKIKLNTYGKKAINLKAVSKSGGSVRKTIRVLYLPE
ncbi:MAG: S-layer homology domain-containing protein, partial [Candidatus Margulisbacteria bacterium]|nr:S-layer homology domain-containing protein [Candidatus Margulisiibacteriota bacterium]